MAGQEVARTRSVPALVDLLGVQTLPAVGAAVGALVLATDGELSVHLSVVEGSPVLQKAFGELPLGPAAVSGQRVLLPTGPDASTGTSAWTLLPLTSEGSTWGSLVLGWGAPQVFDVERVASLEDVAEEYAHAVGRIRARELRDSATAAAVGMSEALQRSLLTPPHQPVDLEVVARYRPATEKAQIGGDWYDSFPGPRGNATLVVGDVSGHDREAAAAMGQLRNLLRGIAFTVDAEPSAVVAQMDRALLGLDVGTMATAVLVGVEPAEPRTPRILTWTNAGHPPPLLLHPEGCAILLDTPPELLLGSGTAEVRTDHRVVLPPGGTLLLFTDGLVERRGVDVQDGLDWLAATVAGTTAEATSPDRLCDGLLDLVAGSTEDDVVLLAVRARVEGASTVRTGSVPADGNSGAAVRRFVRETCREAGTPPVTSESVEVVAGEFCTTLQASGGALRVRVEAGATHVCVQLGDDAPGHPAELPVTTDLATRWGVRDDTVRGLTGKTLWACFDVLLSSPSRSATSTY